MREVSVIIPTYNYARYLSSALDSVLAQTFQDFEILVVDDGSTDDTETVLRRYDKTIRYIRQPNSGVSVARNRGIEESTGHYVAFLDADDTWFPQKLERQLTALQREPTCRICYSAFLLVDADLKPLGVKQGGKTLATLASLLTSGNVVGSMCTVLAERSLFELTGGFDPSLSQCADWDMWVRLAAHSSYLYLDEPLVTYRQHGTSMSTRVPLFERDSLRVLEKGFAMPNLPPGLLAQRQRAFARMYMVLAGSYYHARDYGSMLRCVGQALTRDPRQLLYPVTLPVRAWQRWRTPRVLKSA